MVASTSPPVPLDHPAARVPLRAGLAAARSAAADCRACELYANATQTVFGRGPARARVVLVGEQPGDREDVEGAPFVGPAGRVLDEALAAAGIRREEVFLTNIVKHFRWKPDPRGKRRLHEKPGPRHVRACRPWLDLELAMIEPSLVVLLGATAAQGVLGPGFKVTTRHGEVVKPLVAGGPRFLATIHPSAVLRMRTGEERQAAMDGLVADLVVARRALASRAA